MLFKKKKYLHRNFNCLYNLLCAVYIILYYIGTYNGGLKSFRGLDATDQSVLHAVGGMHVAFLSSCTVYEMCVCVCVYKSDGGRLADYTGNQSPKKRVSLINGAEHRTLIIPPNTHFIHDIII